MLLIIFEVSSLLTQNNNAWSFHIIIIIIIIISIRNPDSEFKGSVYIQDQIIIGTINIINRHHVIMSRYKGIFNVFSKIFQMVSSFIEDG